MSKRWIYHKSEKPKIIENEEFAAHEKKGWKDSPAAFVKLDDCGIDPDDALGIQALGEAVDGVVEFNNAMVNLDVMTRFELVEFIAKHIPTKPPKKLRKPGLIKYIMRWADIGNSEEIARVNRS